MTRLHPVVFAIILGLLTAAVLFVGVYYTGDMDVRLTWALGMGAFMLAIAWFNAMRVRSKSTKEQSKARWITLGLMLMLIFGNFFADYKRFEASFISGCTASYGAQLCKCIENRAGPKTYMAQLPYRPQVVVGSMTERDLQQQARRDSRTALSTASGQCSANPNAR